MKKTLIITLGIFITLIGNLQAQPESYLRINPKVTMGKMEDGNWFYELLPAKFNYQVNDWFYVKGGASVSFTSPRGSLSMPNHYANVLKFVVGYKPFKRVGFFLGSQWSNKISGNDTNVSYLSYGNAQYVGMEIDWIEIKK